MFCARRFFRSSVFSYSFNSVHRVPVKWNSTKVVVVKSKSDSVEDEKENAKEDNETKEDKPKKQTVKKVKKKRFTFKLGPVHIFQAVDLAKQHKWAKFDETVEITLVTGLDPRKPNQSVKGIAKLPFGSGKKLRIGVICTASYVQDALEAGADVAGEEVLTAIQGGDTNFTTIIATPEMMPQVGKIGRILGPRGLMPNPKLGTVTKEVGKAVRASKAGSVQYKTEKKGGIQGAIGKISFAKADLLENIKAFMLSVKDARPESFKGKYLKRAYLSTTMGPGIEIDLSSIDPGSAKFMIEVAGYKSNANPPSSNSADSGSATTNTADDSNTLQTVSNESAATTPSTIHANESGANHNEPTK